MLRNCSELSSLVSGVKPRTSIQVPKGDLSLYLSSIEDSILDQGYLNIILKLKSGIILGIPVEEFRKSPVVASGQQRLPELNASCIMGILLDQGKVHAQHWDGFNTCFDATTFEVIRQVYTK